MHPVDRSLNTGAAVILVAGGGHNTLNVGGESADFVGFFYNYGVNTIILRNRLRRDGYNPQTDEVYDAQQAIRMVRAHAKDLQIDPNKIPKVPDPQLEIFVTSRDSTVYVARLADGVQYVNGVSQGGKTLVQARYAVRNKITMP